MNPSPLELKSVSMSYERRPIVWNVSFSLEVGKIAGLMGPNGAGKTTLLKGILGLVPLQTGNVKIFGEAIKSKKSKPIAYVAQRSSIDWDFPINVFDFVLMGRYAHLGLCRRPGKIDKEIAFDALRKTGMDNFFDRPISDLSGGQQQRMFVARALAQEADLLLLDEPFAGVDVTTEEVLVELFKAMASQGKSFLVIHHDFTTAAKYFDRILLLNSRLVADGNPSDVLNPESLKKVFNRSSAPLS